MGDQASRFRKAVDEMYRDNEEVRGRINSLLDSDPEYAQAAAQSPLAPGLSAALWSMSRWETQQNEAMAAQNTANQQINMPAEQAAVNAPGGALGGLNPAYQSVPCCRQCGLATNSCDVVTGLCVTCLRQQAGALDGTQGIADQSMTKGLYDEQVRKGERKRPSDVEVGMPVDTGYILEALELCIGGPNESTAVRVTILRDAIAAKFPIGRTLEVLRALNEIGGAM